MTAPIFPETPAWMSQALCAQVDTELFWPEKGGSSRPALGVCNRCEVREACLQYALDNNEIDGIWGGVTPRVRRAMRKEAA